MSSKIVSISNCKWWKCKRRQKGMSVSRMICSRKISLSSTEFQNFCLTKTQVSHPFWKHLRNRYKKTSKDRMLRLEVCPMEKVAVKRGTKKVSSAKKIRIIGICSSSLISLMKMTLILITRMKDWRSRDSLLKNWMKKSHLSIKILLNHTLLKLL